MLIACMALGGCLVGVIIYTIYYRMQVCKLAKQIQFHRLHESNIDIHLDLKTPELILLRDEFMLYKRNVNNRCLQYEKREEELKAAITDISHDIRTPLTSISGYVQMLQMSKDKACKEEYFNIIFERLTVLKNMLNELFVFSKIENGTNHDLLDALDIKKVLTDELFSYYDAFSEKQIDLQITLDEEQIMICCVEEELHRIILNLIKNVLIHGSVLCQIHLMKKDKKAELIFLNQTKEKLPMNLDSVFERYCRGDIARSSQESTGLGLSIVKGLVEKNNGEVSCFSPTEDQFGICIRFDCLNH